MQITNKRMIIFEIMYRLSFGEKKKKHLIQNIQLPKYEREI